MRRIGILILFNCMLALLVPLPDAAGQESYFSLNVDSLSGRIPELNSKIDISVSNVSMQEFLRAIANSSSLNLNVDPAISETVVNNFNNVRVRDMLLFLERNYPIDIEIIGNIVNIRKRDIQETVETDFRGVKYDSIKGVITLDYYQADLNQMAREVTKLTEYNIILSPSIATKKVTGYVEQMPFKGAMEQFAYSNDLAVRVTESGYYVLDPILKKEDLVQPNLRSSKRNNSVGRNEEEYFLDVMKTGNEKLKVHCSNAPLEEVIRRIGDEMDIPYYIGTSLEGNISINTGESDFETFLGNALKGSGYLYHEKGGIYIIGSSESPELKLCRIFQFQNRTLDGVVDLLPEDLKQGLMISEFPDLNSLLITGQETRIGNLTNLLTKIDKTVPVILIEVIIVNISKNYTISTGLEAGIGDVPVETLGQVYPGVDMQIGANEINRMLGNFDGFGVLNLSNVTPNLYLVLKAMEEQGILDVKSTPKLSTLNGYEASMTIGNTAYYLEETSNYIGTQNPSLSTSKVYKSVKAELVVHIRPIVSGDDQITLNILVEQSDFTERISQEAPPGSVSRRFESQVRIKNQEMIILGGLEENRYQDSSSGVPILSRIPIIKWIFSSRTRQDQKTKLSIFIKPTIIG